MVKRLLLYIFFIFIFLIILSGGALNFLLKNIEVDAFNSLISYRYISRIVLNKKESANLAIAIKKFSFYVAKDKSLNNKDQIIEDFLNSLNGVVIVYKGKVLKGSFNKDSFYLMDYIPELDIFIGKRVKYSEIYSIKQFFDNASLKIKEKIRKYVLIYFLAIIFIYILFLLIYKKELNEIDEYIEKIHHISIKDNLTGLYNRGALNRLTDKIMDKKLIVLDLDNFKYINDTFGHKIGDRVLVEFSALLKNYFKDDIIIRWGGDEFLIFTDKDYEKIVEIIYEMNQIILKIQYSFDKEQLKKLTVSAGVCEDVNLPYEEKFKNADLALYKVKKTKKGKVLKYSNIDYVRLEKEE